MGINRIRTVVIPVAGRGTRLLPATKNIRKEMLPLGRKPLIQYAVEEARASGMERVVFVCHPKAASPLDYFERDLELEEFLREHGREEEAQSLASLGDGLDFSVVYQEQPRGLADAIGCARVEVGYDPFAVLLPDALIISGEGETPCLAQLMDCASQHEAPVVAVRKIRSDETRHYGIIDIDPRWKDAHRSSVRIQSLVEKPDPEKAPSLYGIFGRYILTPEIFSVIDILSPDNSGELQITDALCLYCSHRPIYGALFSGLHYDVGNWNGYEEADKYLCASKFRAEDRLMTPHVLSN